MKSIDDALGDIPGLRRAVEESPFDAVVACSPENVRYAADAMISTQRSIRDRLALIVWAKGHEPVFVLCQVEEGYIRRESWITDIRSYKEFVTAPTELAASVLTELGLARAHIGCELDYLPIRYASQLATALPNMRLSPPREHYRRILGQGGATRAIR